MSRVHCATHGDQPRTLVCQHIAQGLASGQRVGFFWTSYDPGNPRPDAWCLECENRVRQEGGEWVGVALEHLGPKVLCGECYDFAKAFNLGARTD
jgi:hypothetical protein